NLVDGTGTIAGLTQFPITYDSTGLSELTIDCGFGGNVINVGNTFNGDHGGTSGIGRTTLNSGRGAHTVNVLGAAGVLFTNGQDGRDLVTIGNAGRVQGIQNFGGVYVSNESSFTDLVVDDSADNVPQPINLGDDNVFPFARGGFVEVPNTGT